MARASGVVAPSTTGSDPETPAAEPDRHQSLETGEKELAPEIDLVDHYRMVQRIGLYYPYIHFRSDEWLKTAALYWPQMARIVPRGYRTTRDSETTRALVDSLGFVVNVAPELEDQMILATSMRVAIRDHQDELRGRFGVAGLAQIGHRHASQRSTRRLLSRPWTEQDISQLNQLAGLHNAKIARDLADELIDLGLAVRNRANSDWIGVHPDFAWIYMCALADRMAETNRLTSTTHTMPLTDDIRAYPLSSSTASDLVARLSGRHRPRPEIENINKLVPLIGLLAVRTVIPANINDIPIKTIVRLRQSYSAEFDAFYETVKEVSSDLSRVLVDITSGEILDSYLRQAVRQIRSPIDELQRAFRGLGIDTIFSAASVKIAVPAAAGVAAAGLFADHPVAGTVGGLAFGLLSVGRDAKAKRRELLTPSAASYLWHVKRTTARSLLRRVLSA